MFGLSFGELCVLIIVAVIVFGPQELPKVLRKAGQWAGKIRRFAYDLRAQSGIDEVLRAEGLDRDLAEIRKLARGELDGAVAAVRSATRLDDPVDRARPGRGDPEVDHEREYPRDGADSYGAIPDTAALYIEAPPKSRWADDPLYARGERAHDATEVSEGARKVPSPPPPAAAAPLSEEP